MGLYDTINQGNSVQSAVTGSGPMGVGNGGSFAQKQQMRANPVMAGRPSTNSWAPVANAALGAAKQMGMQKPNPTAGQVPGTMGSRDSLQAKTLAVQNKQSGGIGGSFGQLSKQFPQLNDYRNTGMKSGQDMSWMDKPGALQLPANYGQKPDVVRPQSGISNLQTPYDQSQNPAPTPSPMQAAAEQMRGYDGPDLGSQDPRELARMGRMGPLQGSVGTVQAPPFEGTPQSAGPGLQETMRGIGPSPVIMDENGLEPRRGAR